MNLFLELYGRTYRVMKKRLPVRPWFRGQEETAQRTTYAGLIALQQFVVMFFVLKLFNFLSKIYFDPNQIIIVVWAIILIGGNYVYFSEKRVSQIKASPKADLICCAVFGLSFGLALVATYQLDGVLPKS